MTDASQAAASEYFHGFYCNDRKKWLCAAGVLWILVGAYYVLDIVGTLTGYIASPQMWQWHALVAAWFILMGIGSIQARRWARALMLVTSWFWLIYGIQDVASFLLWGPDKYGHWIEKGWISASEATAERIFLLAAMFVGQVVVPYLSIRFYSNPHIKATCERRDRQVRWTDRCPLPVLFISFTLGCWAYSGLLAGIVQGWVTSFLGTIVRGSAGAASILIAVALCIYAAWGVYRLKTHAWFVAFLVELYWTVEALILWLRNSDVPHPTTPFGYHSVGQAVFFGLWRVAFLAYLLYARRFFLQPAAVVPGAPNTDESNMR